MPEKIILRHPRDVSALVNSGKISGGNSRFVILIALAGIFMDAFDFTSIAFGMSYVQKEFSLTPLELGITAGALLVGALAGSLSGGILMDRIGREKVFTADLIVLIIATILCALAPNAWVFIIARFIMGFAVGVDYPVALSFVAEYSSQKKKGSSLNLYAPVWYVAVASTFALLLAGYFLFESLGLSIGSLWRWVVGFGVVPALIVLILRRKYLTESPTWLARNGNLHEVAALLKRAYGVDVAVAPDAVLEMPKDTKIIPTSQAFGRLWQGKYRIRTILSLIVNFCQGTQYYAVGFSIGLVTQQILGASVLNGIIGPLVFNIVFGVTGGLVAVGLASKVGIRRLAMFGFCLTTTSVLLVNVFGKEPFPGAVWVACLFLGLFMFGHAVGPGTQGVVLATMSYPTSIRGAGVGFAQIGNRTGGTLGLVFWPVLTAAFGLNALLLIAIIPFLGFLALLLIKWDPTHVDVEVDDFEEVSRVPETAAAPSA